MKQNRPHRHTLTHLHTYTLVHSHIRTHTHTHMDTYSQTHSQLQLFFLFLLMKQESHVRSYTWNLPQLWKQCSRCNVGYCTTHFAKKATNLLPRRLSSPLSFLLLFLLLSTLVSLSFLFLLFFLSLFSLYVLSRFLFVSVPLNFSILTLILFFRVASKGGEAWNRWSLVTLYRPLKPYYGQKCLKWTFRPFYCSICAPPLFYALSLSRVIFFPCTTWISHL